MSHQITTFTYDEDLFSDLHKDTYGFRPRTHRFYEAPPEEKQEIWNSTCEALEQEIKYQEEAEKKSEIEWGDRISKMQSDYGINKGTAIRWDMQAFESEDIGYYCYLNGISYSRRPEISSALPLQTLKRR